MDGGFQSYWDFENRLRHNELGTVLVFSGEETFLAGRALSALRRQLFPPGEDATGYETYETGEIPLTQFVNLACSLPMFSPSRLLVLQQAERLAAADLPVLEAFMEKPPRKSTVIFQFGAGFNPRRGKPGGGTGQTDKAEKALQILQKKALHFHFVKLKEDRLLQYLRRYVEEEGIQIPPAGLSFLSQRLGGELDLIVNELQKLRLLTEDGAPVNQEMLEQIVARNPAATIFDFLDSVARRDLPAAFQRLEAQVESGSQQITYQLLGVLSMMARMLRQTMIFKRLREQGRPESEILRELGLKMEFQLRTPKLAHANYRREELWLGLQLLAQAEERIKLSRAEPRLHLEIFLQQFCGRPAGPRG